MQVEIISDEDYESLVDYINDYIKKNINDIVVTNIQFSTSHSIDYTIMYSVMIEYETKDQVRLNKLNKLRETNTIKDLFNKIINNETDIPKHYIDEINDKFWNKIT